MPIVSNCIWDTKEVKKIAKETTLKSMKTCDNNDIKNIIPVILDSIENPENVAETLYKLSSAVFVNQLIMQHYH